MKMFYNAIMNSFAELSVTFNIKLYSGNYGFVPTLFDRHEKLISESYPHQISLSPSIDKSN